MTTRDVQELTVEVEDGVQGTVIVVGGEIDMATAPRLRAYLDGVTALDRGGVVLDMAAVTFMDSTGLGVITGAARRLAERGFELVIRAPEPRVQRLLDVSGIARLLRVRAS